MRNLILAAALVAATPATAVEIEEYVVETHGEWQVILNVPDGNFSPYCSLETRNEYGEKFSLVSADNGEQYTLVYSMDVGDELDGLLMERAFRRGEWDTTELRIGSTVWQVELKLVMDMPGDDGFLIFATGATAYKFRQGMAQGHYMANEFESGWSLNGTAAGMRDLDKCAKRAEGLL